LKFIEEYEGEWEDKPKKKHPKDEIERNNYEAIFGKEESKQEEVDE